MAFATASVILLVGLALGKREAVIVGGAVILTLTATLFASWAWGFTLNRVSLFALIFSIGILVDDAIVVVENIHRRRRGGHCLGDRANCYSTICHVLVVLLGAGYLSRSRTMKIRIGYLCAG